MSAAPGGLVPPLYLHSSLHTDLRGRLSESGPELEWEHRMAQISRMQVCSQAALCHTEDVSVEQWSSEETGLLAEMTCMQGRRQCSSWCTKCMRICQLITLQRSHCALRVGALKR